MKISDIIYLILEYILNGAILGLSIFYLCEGSTITGLFGIALAITNSFDAWYHVSKWNRMEDRIKRIRKRGKRPLE